MPNREKILDDVARVAGGAVSVFSGLQKQIKDEIKTHIEDIAARMDLVPREDLDRVEAMVVEARAQQEEQNKKIEALEQRLAKIKK